MLVLTRRPDADDPNKATICIGHGIEVRVIEVRGDQVRVAIAAPREIPVHRLEVYQQIKGENQASAGADVPTVGKTPGEIRRAQRAP